MGVYHIINRERRLTGRLLPRSKKSNVLFVTAHPDDECMFFSPSILSMLNWVKYDVFLLCLSRGKKRRLSAVNKGCRSLRPFVTRVVSSPPKSHFATLRALLSQFVTLHALAGIPGSPAAFCHFLMDVRHSQAVQSCHVQSEVAARERPFMTDSSTKVR